MPPSPLQRLRHPVAETAGVSLYVKRDDLYGWSPLDPLQGNKVRKLAPLLSRSDLPGRTVVSFGGAFSNHVAALCSAGARFGFFTRFYIRGEAVGNPTLDFALRNGSTLHFVDRSAYRRKHQLDIQRAWGITADEIVVPEGGTHPGMLSSTGAIYTETVTQLGRTPDYFCLSAGTGGTAAGVVWAAAGGGCRIEVFPALKGDWMGGEIRSLLPDAGAAGALDVVTGYAFGGYGKFPREWRLYTPPGGLAKRADIGEELLPALEPVYTAKLFAGVLNRLASGCYARGSTVVVLHSGGIY